MPFKFSWIEVNCHALLMWHFCIWYCLFVDALYYINTNHHHVSVVWLDNDSSSNNVATTTTTVTTTTGPTTLTGARDTDVSRAPGFLFFYTAQNTLQQHKVQRIASHDNATWPTSFDTGCFFLLTDLLIWWRRHVLRPSLFSCYCLVATKYDMFFLLKKIEVTWPTSEFSKRNTHIARCIR